ncbi:MAG: GTPase HflX [Bacteroidales bacterium]|jgi:GTP-binding protein HflX|nr:GTPase HflX [Bacteroidales bacterium]NLK79780.1 GTPase HflX [Bacteroidales bacterium]HKM30744.1 GTPase HflX [Bacteroidales bacterium]HPX79350.1 GTPase HflX [Bacteroidales bacterium]HQB23018.1 GTPase HflX [Bacteroidales bacterium]
MNTSPQRDKAVFVGVQLPGTDSFVFNDHLDELEFLADTAGLSAAGRFVQRLPRPLTNTYLGKGKLEELAAFLKAEEIETVIFDDELTPTQLRNLDKALDCNILDRTNLILDIFAQRAKTAYAKTQVELAQYQYLLPRLIRMWTHLERQRGGIGMRGPGETQLETDRRIILDKISLLKERLKKIDKQMMSQRSNRGSLVRMSLVGYTNVGKSTILNLLAKTDVLAENKLFATLDTTVRKVVVDNIPFLLSDTVGFIRKLPTQLIESFKSTLDEVRESDVLIHVVDIAHPNFEDMMHVVSSTLKDIGCADKPVYLVFNKIDAYAANTANEDGLSLEELQKSWMSKLHTPSIFISATEKTNLEKLRKDLYGMAAEIQAGRYPFGTFLW